MSEARAGSGCGGGMGNKYCIGCCCLITIKECDEECDMSSYEVIHTRMVS